MPVCKSSAVYFPVESGHGYHATVSIRWYTISIINGYSRMMSVDGREALK